MKHLVRTFVGIRCGRAVRRRMHAAAMDLRGGDASLKVPAFEDIHLTLQYLGNTPQEDIAPIGEALEEAVEGFGPIDVVYRGLGAFPNAQRPRVLWAGVEDPTGEDRIGALVQAIGRRLRRIGYRPEKRAFHAHVTLARVHRRPPERVFEALAASEARPEEMDFGAETLSDLKLILSDPGHRPYHYIDLTTVSLGG
ncbi:MAG: RNA 2',3'-cyclic phosphodiesterase [Planctomycetota bacterium]|nr:RNA 2',3'-cyclic phosphodiesterase [Planctomycetota bacterium]